MLLEQILSFLGSIICHQIPERTIFIDGVPLPVCARDTGIYTGVFVSLCFIVISKRWNSDKPVKLTHALILCLMTFPMMLDGVSSYLGFRESSNLIRIITGGLFGFPIPVFLIALKNYKVYEPNTKPILKSWTEIIILAALVLISVFIVYSGIIIPLWAAASILIGTMMFLLYNLVLVIVSFLPFRSRFYRNLAAGVVFCLFMAVMHWFDIYMRHIGLFAGLH